MRAQTWVDGWLREAGSESASQREQRPQVHINTPVRQYAKPAHQLKNLQFQAPQLSLPTLTNHA
ncbi:virulence factor SrfB, partial [Erwinia amylovora]|uniref:virulence factor SrfB n=1 Tax=Erwinia amylovora TaxID=552 RepID=UPI0020C12582